jgi:hypothetical protein
MNFFPRPQYNPKDSLKSVRREFSSFSVGITEDQYSHLRDKAESSFRVFTFN